MNTLTDQLTSIEILMDVFRGVNLVGEVMRVYNNYATEEDYENLPPADMQRVDSLFARIMLAFDLQSAGLKDYSNNQHDCSIFKSRSTNFVKAFGRDYITTVLIQALALFKRSGEYADMNEQFERENFVFRFETLIEYLGGCE
jgi:hypothetical protein